MDVNCHVDDSIVLVRGGAIGSETVGVGSLHPISPATDSRPAVLLSMVFFPQILFNPWVRFISHIGHFVCTFSTKVGQAGLSIIGRPVYLNI